MGASCRAFSRAVTGILGRAWARMARLTPSCFRANSMWPSKSSAAGAVAGGTAKVWPIFFKRVTGCTIAGRCKGNADSCMASRSQA
ncbi:hypothetical protein D3C76_1377400 [compost metagenome]